VHDALSRPPFAPYGWGGVGGNSPLGWFSDHPHVAVSTKWRKTRASFRRLAIEYLPAENAPAAGQREAEQHGEGPGVAT
jgi:hypothetical protein